MNSLSSSPGWAVSPAAADPLSARLHSLYTRAQGSDYLFASPLGPFFYHGQSAYLPRFVFFGPGASDESWRVALLAGFDHRDQSPAHALLGFIEDLERNAGKAYGLNLTFFPLVDAAGFFLGAPPRPLAAEHWGRSRAPEIDLLEKDARLRAYHGFVRVESAPAGDDMISVRVRAPASAVVSPDVELISSEDTDPFPVRFECGSAPAGGPLSVAEDLPVSPFELTLRIPPAWSGDAYSAAVTAILHHFILRYRAFQAYGQHL